MLPIFHQFIGSILVLTGLVVLPLPIPLGVIMLAIGFALLAPYIPVIRRFLKFLRAKWPDLDRMMVRYRDRCPPVIKKTIDRTHPTHSA